MRLDVKNNILIIDNNFELASSTEETLRIHGFVPNIISERVAIFDSILNFPPHLIIIDLEAFEGKGEEVCRELQEIGMVESIPKLLLIPNDGSLSDIKWEDLKVDDYLMKPFSTEELLARVALNFYRSTLHLDSNALTHLPGNLCIVREIQKRIESGEIFSVGYADVDNFKSFNDRYGFARGDEVIRMVAKLLTNVIGKMGVKDFFIGHIGGDDFIFILSPKAIDEACQSVIKYFDSIVSNFYDEKDKAKGYLEGATRQGENAKFPLMTISIGVASNEKNRFKHFAEASEIASNLKNCAKKIHGSYYIKDRRNYD